MSSISRILTLLAGAAVGVAVLRRKENSNANAKPWRTDLDALESKFTQQLELRGTELTPKPDPRVADLAARLAAVESKAESTRGKVDDLQQNVSAQDQKLEATNQVMLAIEQLLTTKMAGLDQRIEAQGRTLDAINSSIAQSDELLQRVLDRVQNLSPSTAAGGREMRELQL
jgi:chromosome segregation ATPase